MKKIIFYLMCMLLLWSCGKIGTNKTDSAPVQTTTSSSVEIDRHTDSAETHPVNITQKSLEHIIARHWSASDAQGAGKFSKEITVTVLKDLIETTATQGTFRANTHGRPGKIAEYDFGRAIGTTINGSSATHLRIVIAPNGNIITAFPY